MNIEEFEKLLKINRTDLDGELIRQPEIFYNVAKAHVQSVSLYDQAKTALKGAAASLDLEIREDGISNNKKPTEKFIENKILADEDYQIHVYELLKLKEKFDILSALRDAFQQRGYMLRDLCVLYSAGHFIDPGIHETPQQKIRKETIQKDEKTGRKSIVYGLERIMGGEWEEILGHEINIKEFTGMNPPDTEHSYRICRYSITNGKIISTKPLYKSKDGKWRQL